MHAANLMLTIVYLTYTLQVNFADSDRKTEYKKHEKRKEENSLPVWLWSYKAHADRLHGSDTRMLHFDEIKHSVSSEADSYLKNIGEENTVAWRHSNTGKWLKFNILKVEKIKKVSAEEPELGSPNVYWRMLMTFRNISFVKRGQRSFPFDKNQEVDLQHHLPTQGSFTDSVSQRRIIFECRNKFILNETFLSSILVQFANKNQRTTGSSATELKSITVNLSTSCAQGDNLMGLRTLYLYIGKKGLKSGSHICCDIREHSVILIQCSLPPVSINSDLKLKKSESELNFDRRMLNKHTADLEKKRFKFTKLYEALAKNEMEIGKSVSDLTDVASGKADISMTKYRFKTRRVLRKRSSYRQQATNIHRKLNYDDQNFSKTFHKRKKRQARQKNDGPPSVRMNSTDRKRPSKHERQLDRAQLKKLMEALKLERTKDPLWALLSVITLMVVMFWAVWACGMKRIDRSKHIQVDLDEDFHTVSVKDVIKSKHRFLPRNLFRSNYRRQGYMPLREVDISDPDPMSDTSEDEKIIYARNYSL